MRNLKEENTDVLENELINDRRNVSDRAYYENKLTSNILYTKTSYVPREHLTENIFSDTNLL